MAQVAGKLTTIYGQRGARSLVTPRALSPLRRTGQPFELAVLLALGSMVTMPPVHADSFVIVNGQIETETQVLGAGDTGTVESGGTISTTGDEAYGITITGGNAILNNSGSVSTGGSGAYGIASQGDNATILSSGSISTMGNRADGIYAEGNNATTTNSGIISTVGVYARGINSSGFAQAIRNTGSISTQGYGADGIYSEGDNAITTNSGSISTVGDHAYGFNSSGLAEAFHNNGTITTTGADSFGIYTDNSEAAIFNIGRISTTGNGSVGIEIFEIDSAVTNSGTISTTGIGAHGIVADRANSTITNSGLISATGSGSFAILGGGASNQTLNILPGSRIIGAIDLGGGGDTVNITGSYGSTVLSFANVDTINVLTPNAVRLGTSNTVVVIDPTGESSRAQSLSALSGGIHTVISQGLQNVALMRPVKVAALELTPGLLSLDTAPVAWGQVFGGQSRKDSNGQLLGFTQRYAGLIGGYEQAYQGDRVGLVAGIANGYTSSAMTGMNSDSVFAGLYRHTRLGELNLTGSLVAGVEQHTSRRTVFDNINGYESARASTTSYYLSPSISVSRSYAVAPVWTVRPSAVLGYSVGWYAGYTESGTTQSNQTLGARTVQTLTGRAQLELARQTGWGEASVRAGLQMRQTSQGAVTGSVGGSDFRFNAVGDNNVNGGYVGLGMRQALREQLSLMADVEYGQLSGKETQVLAKVSLQYVF